MLELNHICKDWQARVLLRDVNLSVASGQTVAILGPSGSGKSTLLKIVAGLEGLDAGSVLFDDQDISAMPPERRRFALMFQDFALFPHLDVQDNVAFGLVEQGLRKVEARVQACAMLERFGLQGFARSKVTRLSGGEQQRVALARALINQPRVILADEPTGALDTELRDSVADLLFNTVAEQGVALVIATHDPALSASADATYVLSEGEAGGYTP